MKDIPYAHPAWIEVDLAQFKQNISLIKQFIGAVKLCVPIKANAYGHGLIPIARAAVAAGVDYLAVSCLQEGVLLREAGIEASLLVLGPVHAGQVSSFLRYRLDMTVSSIDKAKMVAKECPMENHSINIHAEVDTGMNRTGVRISSAAKLLDYIEQTPCFNLAGIYTHLATADQPNHELALQQISVFNEQIKKPYKQKFPKALFHIANSGGTCFYPQAHADMVRPGKMVFGYFKPAAPGVLEGIRPVFSIKARVAYFKVVEEGQGISYGHTYTTSKNERVVTIPIGYGDGYRRALSNKAKVLIHGKFYPVVGTICMDQFMVSIGHDEAHVGDEVVLVGQQGKFEITLDDLARQCDTVASEILCGFNDRLPHLYCDNEQQFWEYLSLSHSTFKF